MSNQPQDANNTNNVKEIIDAVLKHVGMRAPSFAKAIGLNYQRIFDLQSGRTKKFNPGVVNAICEAFPEINKNYLYTGEGSLTVAPEGAPVAAAAPEAPASAAPAAAPCVDANPAISRLDEFVDLSRKLLDLYQSLIEKEERVQAKFEELNQRERELLAYERQLLNRR